MKAELVYHIKEFDVDESIIEIKIWKIPGTKEKATSLKCSFVYIRNGERVIGYDNAEGKGHHRHYMDKEYNYKFKDLDKLWNDFRKDIKRFKEGIL